VALQQINVFWVHRFIIPKAIANKISSIVTNFFWSGAGTPTKPHFCKWADLAIPKEFGGWGFLENKIFGQAPLIKSFWGAINSLGIWQDIIHTKYLRQSDMEGLFMNNTNIKTNGSLIWRSFMKIIL